MSSGSEADAIRIRVAMLKIFPVFVMMNRPKHLLCFVHGVEVVQVVGFVLVMVIATTCNFFGCGFVVSLTKSFTYRSVLGFRTHGLAR